MADVRTQIHIVAVSSFPWGGVCCSLQANPDLPASDPGLIEEFEAAPWLLPPRTAALPYAGSFKRLCVHWGVETPSAGCSSA